MMHLKKLTGFTLLEILVALFVFAILSTIIVGAIHNTMTTQDVTEKHAQRLTELQTALTIISRDFEQTVNRPITAPEGQEVAFIGSATTVAFTHGGLSNPMGQLQRSTLQRVTYLLNDDNLIRVTWPILDHAMKVKADERILLTHVSKLYFTYLTDKQKFLAKWPNQEQPQAVLPKAVHMTLVLQDLGKISQIYAIPAQVVENKAGQKVDKKPK